MAWNPSPEVAVARDAANALKADRVVVVYVRRSDSAIGMASYGATKASCSEAGKLGDHLFDRTLEWFGVNEGSET